MIGTGNFLLLLTAFSQLLVTGGFAEDVDIDVSSYDPAKEETHVFYVLMDSVEDDITQFIVMNNVSKFSGFYIVQAHSYRYNVSLSYSGDPSLKRTGYNVGVVRSFQNSFADTFILKRLTNETIKVLMVVSIYEEDAPIPGGCPSNHLSGILPSLTIKDGPSIISLQAQAASLKDYSCNASNDIQVEIYHKYLQSNNFEPYHYFEGIISMTKIKDIRDSRSGIRFVSSSKGIDSYKKLFSSYVGVGEVFVVLTTLNGKTSAYVPAVSYGEDINLLIEGKENVSFVSLILICRGHALFHFTTFSLGLSFGTIISFFILSRDGASADDDTLLWSFLIGTVYASVWVFIWHECGLPLFSATLAFLHTGALIVSTLYYFGVADYGIFHYNGIYWSVFFAIMLICWVFLSIFTMHGHIFSCAFLGSYILMITTLNCWMGANLQYIVVNVYRRISIQDFNKVYLDPPCQDKDVFIMFCGLIFLLRGYHHQVKNQRGKPPFPPHCSHTFDDERSPLLRF